MELRLHTALEAAYQRAAAVAATATTLQSVSRPAAQKAFDVVSQGYRNGRFGYLEVLDAQRTLFSTRSELIEALREHEQQLATIERLTAAALAAPPHAQDTRP